MDLLSEPLAHGFMRRALLAGVALAAAAGFLGTFVVQRGLAFLSDGLAHAAFGGIAFGLLLGVGPRALPGWPCPTPCWSPWASASSGADPGSGRTWPPASSSPCPSPWAWCALGLRPLRAPAVDVESLLFGSILAVSEGALRAVLLLAASSTAVLTLLASRLAYATFDAELAALSGCGWPRGIRPHGPGGPGGGGGAAQRRGLLVSALVVLPAATAHLLGARLARSPPCP